MTEIAKFDKQYLLAADVIVALSAEMGNPLNDYSGAGHPGSGLEVEGRKAYMELIRMISDMAGPWDRDNVPERGISDELKHSIYCYRMGAFMSEKMDKILEAFVDTLKALWIGDPTAGMTPDELIEYGSYLKRSAEYSSQEGA
jgi:hypothetical protein